MNKTKPYLIFLTLLFLVVILLILLHKDTNSNTEHYQTLKAASLNCEIGEFRQYMTNDAYSKVAKFEEQMQQLNTLTESILTKCVNKFGSGVNKTDTGIQIPIAGEDSRWEVLFGPQWNTIKSTYPEGPYHFNMAIVMKWEQECKVIQNFLACLENDEFCSEYHIDGSVIRMVNMNNLWTLTYDLPLEKGKKAQKMQALILSLATWTDNYLLQHIDTPSNEDFKYQFATDYFSKMNQLISELTP